MGAIKTKKRQKMCYNCEGEVDLDVIVCPFCAADLRAERPEQTKGAYSPSVHSLKQLNGEEILPPPSSHEERQKFDLAEEEPSLIAETPVQNSTPWLKEALPIGLLTFGGGLFLLGVLLVLFSEDGFLVLRWDASWWFIYAGIGALTLWGGYRQMKDS